jgi:ferric-dicitrate binding protein FerR (iron transport regulator)
MTHRSPHRLEKIMTDNVARTFPLAGPINLDCRLGSGSVTVRAIDNSGEAVVALRPRVAGSGVATATTVEMRGHTLVVRAPKPRGTMFDLPIITGRFQERDAMDVDITVPSGTALKIVANDADVGLVGRSGGADIVSGRTSVDLDQVDGDLRLRYTSGPARIGRVTGTAVVKAGSGSATLAESRRVVMASGSGDLTIDVAHGRVHLRAGSGRARIGVAEDDVDLVSGSGDLSVGLRAGQAARLDVVTGAGRLHSDLPVHEAPPSGSPAITVRARTGRGDVSILRAG